MTLRLVNTGGVVSPNHKFKNLLLCALLTHGFL